MTTAELHYLTEGNSLPNTKTSRADVYKESEGDAREKDVPFSSKSNITIMCVVLWRDVKKKTTPGSQTTK